MTNFTAYKSTVHTVVSHPATVQAVTVAVITVNFAKATIQAGKDARNWWETDEAIAPLIRLTGQVVWLAMALAWSYFVDGKAKAHWTFVNDVVDDGLGLYGPSPMGDALAASATKYTRCLIVASAKTMAYVVGRLGSAVAVRYGRLQAVAFA